MSGLKKAGIIVFAGCFFVWGFISLPFFQIKSIEVSSSRYLSTDQLEVLFSPLKKRPIFSVFVSKGFFRQLSEDLPFISSIDYQLRFPSKLIVTLIEKSPVYSLVTNDDSFLVSKEGYVLNQYSENVSVENMEELIIVKGLGKNLLRENRLQADILDQLSQIVSNMTMYFPNQSLQVEFGSLFNLKLFMDDHLEIKLGTMDYLDIKFTHLNQFLAFYKGNLRQVRYIDLRVEDRIVIGMEER